MARGVVAQESDLELVDSAGTEIPLQARALTFWPDRSIKWVELTFVLESSSSTARAGHAFDLRTSPRAVEAGAKASLDLPLPPATLFELTDGSGAAAFEALQQTPIATGNIYRSTIHTGWFRDREDRTTAAITLSTFPALKATRYQVELEQYVDGETWRSLALQLLHSDVFVHRQREMNATVERPSEKTFKVLLIHDTEPADRGVGRRWEIWGYDDPDRFRGTALRPQFSPEYARTTQTLGNFAVDPPQQWEASFEESVRLVFSKRDANPRNFGWRHFGAFYNRLEDNPSYYGYYNHEYDPATALFLRYAGTANTSYLEHALDLASHFRDMCIDPEGGVYQHRATFNAARAHLLSTMQEKIESQITQNERYSTTVDGLQQSILAVYGDTIPTLRKKLPEKLGALRNRSSAARLETAKEKLASMLLTRAQNEARSKRGDRAPRRQRGAGLLRTPLEGLIGTRVMQDLGFTTVDRAFAPFFERYGGSWNDFPAFHVDREPDPRQRHTGGHSLVEMLVLAYSFTGDEAYRDVATKVAQHHMRDLLPRATQQVEKARATRGSSVRARQLAWPLVNLMAVWELADANSQLGRDIQKAAESAAHTLSRIEPSTYEGSVHCGITLEALARYHEKTGDDLVGAYLIRLARYWAETQWSARGQGFLHKHDNPSGAYKAMTALVLYGLVYAHDLAPDRVLKRTILAARDSLLQFSPRDAKAFAMSYRSTPRAMGIIESWG